MKKIVLTAVLIFLGALSFVLAQTSNRRVTLNDIHGDHMNMDAKMEVATEKLADLDRRLSDHEKLQLSAQTTERIIALETKMDGLLWITTILLGAVLTNVVHNILVNRRMKSLKN